MEQIWPIATAIMLANFATIMLLAGLWRARNEMADGPFNGVTALLIIMPCLFAAGGILIYG